MSSLPNDTQDAPLSGSFYIPVHVSELSERALLMLSGDEIGLALIVAGGIGTIRIEGKLHELGRGSIVLSSGNAKSGLRLVRNRQLEGIVLLYRGYNVITGKEIGGLQQQAPLQRCSSHILRLSDELYHLWKEPRIGDELSIQQLFTSLIIDIYRENKTRQQLAGHWIQKVMEDMDLYYMQDITREQIASRIGVSPEHFSRVFRDMNGRTFQDHLTLLRIRKAQQLLLNNRKRSLLDIAQEVGYKDSFYFSRKFKQFVGTPPTAYRRKKKRFATLNPNHTGCLLALGVMPVLGVYFSGLESEYNTSPIAGAIAEKFDPYAYSADLFYKKIEEAHPDVIVSYDTAPENKSLLFIAPVIGLSVMKQSWREQFQLITDAAGKKETATEWLHQYDQEIEVANQLLDHRYGARGSAIVWEIGDGQAYCLSASYGRGCHILYQDLGFYPPNSVVEQGLDVKGFIETTIENIVAYQADYIFITSLPTDEASCRSIERLFQSEQWQQLEAVQGQRVYILNESELFYGYDPLSTKAQLKVLLQALLSTS